VESPCPQRAELHGKDNETIKPYVNLMNTAETSKGNIPSEPLLRRNRFGKSFRKHATRAAALVSLMLVVALAGESRVQAVPLNPGVTQLLKGYAAEAKTANATFSEFSAEKGKTLYFQERRHSTKNELRSCSNCHTLDPRKSGKSNTGQPIEPLSPAANPKAFTDVKNIEKWFSRNCPWVLERSCSAEEKGHFIAYLFSLGG